MYQTTLEKRQRRVCKEDFAEAPNLVFKSSKMFPTSRILWDELVPYSPAQIYDVIAGGYPFPDLKLNVSVSKKNGFECRIGRNGLKVPFSYQMGVVLGDEARAKYNMIKVAPDAQANGVGKIWLRNTLELAVAFNLPSYHFSSAFDVGGYAWAKAGCYLKDCDASRAYVSEALQARLEIAKPYLPEGRVDGMQRLCRLENRSDIVKIAHVGDISVPYTVLNDAKQGMERYFVSVPTIEEPADARAEREYTALQNVFGCSKTGGESVPLSRYLLKGSAWDAEINFSDHEQMERIGKYVGGWRTIKPASGSTIFARRFS